MIHGVNTEISVEVAERSIRKVFEHRFGQDKVLSVKVYKKSGGIEKLAGERLNLKRKLRRFDKRRSGNHGQNGRRIRRSKEMDELMEGGGGDNNSRESKNGFCSRGEKESEQDLRDKLRKIDAAMREI